MSDDAAWPAVLPMAGRDGLPFALLHRQPLYLHALRSLAASGSSPLVVACEAVDLDRVQREVRRAGLAAEVVDVARWWSGLRRGPGAGLVVHDPLCPLVSAEFVREVRRQALARPDVSFLAFRPVTDTVKTVVDERIQGTIDRETLAALVSPVVIAPRVLGAVTDDDAPPVDDFPQLATWLRRRGETELVRAPSLARRVEDASAVNLLECVDELARKVRKERGSLSGAAGPGTHAGT